MYISILAFNPWPISNVITHFVSRWNKKKIIDTFWYDHARPSSEK